MNRESEPFSQGLARLVAPPIPGLLLLILTGLAVFAAAYVSSGFLSPVLFALVVGVVVAPVSDRLDRLGIPRVITATAFLIVVSGVLAVTAIALEPILSSLATEWPRIRVEIRSWIYMASDLLHGIEDISNDIEETVGVSDNEDGTGIPSLSDALWLAPGFGAKLFVFAGTLFFFVLTRSELYELAGPHRARLFDAEHAVARYFATVTMINLGLGAATAVVLTLIGMPAALLWGVVAGVMNFILYLGPLIVAASLLVAGLVAFDGVMALAPAAAFLCLNLTEAQFVTPSLVGRRMDLNPLFVFLAITFGLWIWGPIGAIIALPVALWVGVLASNRHDLTDADMEKPATGGHGGLS